MTPQTEEECGLGKLTIQLFSFASIDEPQVLLQLFAGFEQLASPVPRADCTSGVPQHSKDRFAPRSGGRSLSNAQVTAASSNDVGLVAF
eukprot:g9173.t1